MRTPLSIPDELFERAESLARERGVSRSQLYATALAAYLDDDSVTVGYNTEVAAGAELALEPDRRTQQRARAVKSRAKDSST